MNHFIKKMFKGLCSAFLAFSFFVDTTGMSILCFGEPQSPFEQ